MKYTLGLNLGISYTAFALVDKDNSKIIKSGVHRFRVAENPKTGASLSTPRREARSARRRLARRRMRLDGVLNLFKKNNFKDVERINEMPCKNSPTYNPLQLRSEGLERQLTDLEFGLAIYHIAKFRGFKSSRLDGNTADADKLGKLLEGTEALKQDFTNSGSPTIGHFLYEKFKKDGIVKNKDGTYVMTCLRDILRDEVKLLCQRQIELGQPKITSELQKKLEDIIFFQRPLKSITSKIGFCNIFPEVHRAVKNAFTSEEFVFWNKINNLRIGSDKTLRELTAEEKENVLSKALEVDKITFKQLRKLLKIDSDVPINLQRINDKETKTFIEFKGYSTLRKVFEKFDPNLWETIESNVDLLDYIAHVLSTHFDESKIVSELKAHPFLKELDATLIDSLCGITTFKGTVSLSLKAMKILLNYMRDGEMYYRALSIARETGAIPSFNQRELEILPPVKKTENPVVDRALSQARKLVNAIIRKYGLPEEIKIELGRDVGKSAKERRLVEKENKKKEEINNQAASALKDMGFENPSKDLIVKYKLWNEQNKICVYSGQEISVNDFMSVKTEISHIIPYGRSFDDSFSNKVLVFKEHNISKMNRTPKEFIQTKDWASFEERVKNIYAKNIYKQKKLLIESFDEKGLIARNINDGRWISSWFRNHVAQNLGSVNKVDSTNGMLTYTLRKSWLSNHIVYPHAHLVPASDAILIAFASPELENKITSYEQKRVFEVQRFNPLFDLPWDSFHDDVQKSISEIQITHMPDRKYSGLHSKETLMSYRGDDYDKQSTRLFNKFTEIESGQRVSNIVKRIPLSSVTLESLNNMVDIKANKEIYDAIKERLTEFKNDPKKAFETPVYFKKKDGTIINTVKKISIYDDSIAVVPVRNGVACNGDLLRLDIFKSDEGYIVSPVYVNDFLAKKLPQTYLSNSLEYPLDPNWPFVITMHKNDYVELTSFKKSTNTLSIVRGFYNTFNRFGSSIQLLDIIEITQDMETGEVITNYYDDKRYGLKTLVNIQKYEMTLLGEKYLVKEKRNSIN